MARVTITTSTPEVLALFTDRALFPNAAPLLDGWGRRAVMDVQRGPWADSMFRKATGRSRKGWTHETAITAGRMEIRLINIATNRYGTRYAPYVHYAGRPKSDKVIRKVDEHLQNVIGPQVAEALVRDFKRALRSGPRVTTTKSYGG